MNNVLSLTNYGSHSTMCLKPEAILSRWRQPSHTVTPLCALKVAKKQFFILRITIDFVYKSTSFPVNIRRYSSRVHAKNARTSARNSIAKNASLKRFIKKTNTPTQETQTTQVLMKTKQLFCSTRNSKTKKRQQTNFSFRV